MRARGLARAFGQTSGAFDLRTVFTPRTRRLGGLGQGPYEMAPVTPEPLRRANLQLSPMIAVSIAPPGASSGAPSGESIPTAGDRVGAARRSTTPSAPSGGYLPAPDVHVPDVMEPPPGFTPPVFDNPLSPVAQLPPAYHGWPWWIWAMIAAGAAVSVYALTRR